MSQIENAIVKLIEACTRVVNAFADEVEEEAKDKKS